QVGVRRRRQTSNSFEFTSWWADARNRAIADLTGFTRTFFAKHTLLNILTKYCVFDVTRKLLAMRPYQIVATERILQRIDTSTTYKQYGTTAAGGYIWHTTGSGKTLTSFKTALLASGMPHVDKVMFVVDRKDLDYQTMKEFNRFEDGAVNGSKNTAALKRALEDPDASIIVTTIQKLSNFITANKGHQIYDGHMVIIFDECHRSQFGDMHAAITKAFKAWHLFGFTGTPIFPQNAASSGNPLMRTTEQAFGERLHAYTIVDAIKDDNVLPFRVATVRTIKAGPDGDDKLVPGIDTEKALLDAERITLVVDHIRKNFDRLTKRNERYSLNDRRLNGFNSLFATASIPAAKAYYAEFKRQQADLPEARRLKVGIIFSYAANEDEDGFLGEEGFETDVLDASSRDFLDSAIRDYNAMFGTSYDTSGDSFQNYYKDLSQKIKDRDIDLAIVVNMFLTGFDATTLNTLWVDKNLRQHGLIQAFSRTNRILNSVKAFGNVVTFRNLEQATNDALALFGNREARGTVLLRSYEEYYSDYTELVSHLLEKFPLDVEIVGEASKKEFIKLFGAILRLRNILTAFDEFAGNEILTARDLQNYQSMYLDLHAEFRSTNESEKESINDDLVFEIELIKQVEVNVDYILMLVENWRDAKGSGSNDREMEALLKIQDAIDASPSLRNKKELIIEFLNKVSVGDVDEQWLAHVAAKRQAELEAIIAEENLKRAETIAFIDAAFRDGAIPTGGTAITKILPATSKFSRNNNYATKKQRVLDRLNEFFDRYYGLM
ncbi:MAG: type I restriction endonuclease subunit R, partial [Pseudonocardiaceae bacterium]